MLTLDLTVVIMQHGCCYENTRNALKMLTRWKTLEESEGAGE